MVTDELTAVYAEQAVLGSAILGNSKPLLELMDADFTDPKCRQIAATIRDMNRRNEPVDEITVSAQLYGRISGVLINELGARVPAPASGGWYADIVRQASRLRHLNDVARTLQERIGAPGSGELADEIASLASESITAMPPGIGATALEEQPTMTGLFDREFHQDFLIPGLVERGERIVVVAGEGAGKSVLLSQFAVAVAGGCHPFTGERTGPSGRVLLIDAENSAQQTQRRFRWIGSRFTKAEVGWANRIVHHIRPEGLDLPSRDRAWLAKVCAQSSPDLIILTPAYKLTRGNPQLDSDMLALLSVMDEIRVRHNAALLIETHSGHGLDESGKRAVRPYGSSVWLRWPEIGLGLARNEIAGQIIPDEFRVGHWRGMREERDWPDLLRRGKPNTTDLPWMPVRPVERQPEHDPRWKD